MTYTLVFYPVCRLDCGTLTSPDNGSLDQISGTTYGQTAVYTCTTGYDLFGTDQVTCMENGQWSADPPVCQITGTEH